MMLERPAEVLTRDELRRRLWPDGTFVDFEHGLNAAVKRLRAALGDNAEQPRFVETLHRHGYRFIGAVERLDVDHEGSTERDRWNGREAVSTSAIKPSSGSPCCRSRVCRATPASSTSRRGCARK